jgi:hypothetical protein
LKELDNTFKLLKVYCPVSGAEEGVPCVAFPRPVKLLKLSTWPDPLLVMLVVTDASSQTLSPEILAGVNVVVNFGVVKKLVATLEKTPPVILM